MRTRPIKTAASTAEAALAAGNLDRARRAVVAGLDYAGLTARAPRPSACPVVLAALVRVLKATAKLADLQAQERRNLFRQGA